MRLATASLVASVLRARSIGQVVLEDLPGASHLKIADPRLAEDMDRLAVGSHMFGVLREEAGQSLADIARQRHDPDILQSRYR